MIDTRDMTPGSKTKHEWLTTKEAATYLRLSVKALHNMTSNGDVPVHKLGRRNRYLKAELKRLFLPTIGGANGN
jgi:excisionase family DNA binding protein